MGKIAKDNLIYMIIGVLIGVLGSFLINRAIDTGGSQAYKEWRETEEFKRDSIRIRMESIAEVTSQTKRQIDSITALSDSLISIEIKKYLVLQSTLKKQKDETLNYLHTVDSAYLIILSRE